MTFNEKKTKLDTIHYKRWTLQSSILLSKWTINKGKQN